MKFSHLIAISALFVSTNLYAANPPSACEQFANTMTSRVVDIFHDKKQTEEQKRKSLFALFQKAVDTDWIGQFVLGRYWKTATPEQQAEYLKYYRDYLTMIYISKFNDEAGMAVDSIDVASIKPSGKDNQFEANTLIKRKDQADVSVIYALEQSPTACQVHDIKVEGISLLISHRSEFEALISKSGIQGVIDAMKKQLSN